MAVKAVNDSAGPEGLVPTLLFFGALPRLGLPNDCPTPSALKQSTAQHTAAAAMSKHNTSRQIRDALMTRNELDVMEINKTPIGVLLLVYRPEKDNEKDRTHY